MEGRALLAVLGSWGAARWHSLLHHGPRTRTTMARASAWHRRLALVTKGREIGAGTGSEWRRPTRDETRVERSGPFCADTRHGTTKYTRWRHATSLEEPKELRRITNNASVFMYKRHCHNLSSHAIDVRENSYQVRLHHTAEHSRQMIAGMRHRGKSRMTGQTRTCGRGRGNGGPWPENDGP